jgi:oligoribonuclease NrnB/cAMP/cGMP phosphodiesterase (DHH superfamily)
VNTLGDYDVWNNNDETYWNDEVMPLQYYMQSLEWCKNPNSRHWPLVFDGNLSKEKALETGAAILSYIEGLKRESLPRAHTVQLHGLTFVCVNTPHRGSLMVDHVFLPKEHDAMMVYAIGPEDVAVSIYTNNPEVDLSEVAVANGGGGHKGAAGFRLSNDEFIERIFKRRKVLCE